MLHDLLELHVPLKVGSVLQFQQVLTVRFGLQYSQYVLGNPFLLGFHQILVLVALELHTCALFVTIACTALLGLCTTK